MRKRIVHVNQNVIKANIKTPGEEKPPITTKGDGHNTYSHGVTIMLDGKRVGELKYRPQQPLSCGARLWLEIEPGVNLLFEDGICYKDLKSA